MEMALVLQHFAHHLHKTSQVPTTAKLLIAWMLSVPSTNGRTDCLFTHFFICNLTFIIVTNNSR